MRYVKNHLSEFDDNSAAYSFTAALLKFLAGNLTEIINIFIIVQAETIDDVVKDFIAFGIISELDDIMVLTLDGVNAEKDLSETSITYSREQAQ
mmetsp:Transcript_10569/g.17734  ORF Transcript_10569/g.17734 Transcript_10569/m.17734 type:complete len:94 (+) Transcript_10569:444-725(+)